MKPLSPLLTLILGLLIGYGLAIAVTPRPTRDGDVFARKYFGDTGYRKIDKKDFCGEYGQRHYALGLMLVGDNLTYVMCQRRGEWSVVPRGQ